MLSWEFDTWIIYESVNQRNMCLNRIPRSIKEEDVLKISLLNDQFNLFLFMTLLPPLFWLLFTNNLDGHELMILSVCNNNEAA